MSEFIASTVVNTGVIVIVLITAYLIVKAARAIWKTTRHSGN